ncbi:unnamed protein product [Trichobilharzia regenti]|nr:unnamed protein product [Trichobilharzia regenti]
MDLSDGWSSRFPFNLFSESNGPGRLFTLQLPDKLLPPDGDQIKEGLFGKIQLLDNQEVRLVVGDARFNLSCPRPLTVASVSCLCALHSPLKVKQNVYNQYTSTVDVKKIEFDH